MTAVTPVTLPSPPAAPFRPVGNPSVAREWAGSLRRSGGLLDERADWVAGEAVALVGTEDGWSGPASQAYAARVRPIGSDLAVSAVAFRAASTAADAYADALQALVRRGEDLAEDYARLTSVVPEFVAQAGRATAGELDPVAVAYLHREAADLRRRVSALADDSARLGQDTQAAEVALVRALAGYPSLAAARARLAATQGQDPALVSGLAKSGLSIAALPGMQPQAAAAWWAGLTDAERDALLVQFPEIIGTLDGIPAGARDTANRTLVDRDIATLEAREEMLGLTGAERAALRNARAVLDQIAVIEGSDDYYTHEPLVAQLYDYEPYAFGGDGRALLSVGDLTTADNVSFTVPGLTATVSGSLDLNTTGAMNLYREARWADSDETTACMVWIGYDAPSDWDSGTVLFEGRARDGGALLAADVAGFQASRGEDQPNLTVIGHSYGGTTTAHAATDVGLDVDSIALIGSPGAGSGVDHADDLGIGADDVWVGAASTDTVSWLGSHGWVNPEDLAFGLGLGNDPAEDTFDAQRFDAELTDRHSDSIEALFTDHTAYFRPGTESLYNLAAIVTGNEQEVLLAEHRTDPWYAGPQDPERDRTPTERTHEQ